jgi:hypothetical protein
MAWKMRIALLSLIGAIGTSWAGGGSARAEAPRREIRHAAASGLEARLALLTKGLDLDPAQQVQLRALLEVQRARIRRVWADPSLSGGDRVGATRAILDRTGDGIRALLTEEQRKRYLPARPPLDVVGPAHADVDHWLRLTGNRGQGNQGEGNHAMVDASGN